MTSKIEVESREEAAYEGRKMFRAFLKMMCQTPMKDLFPESAQNQSVLQKLIDEAEKLAANGKVKDEDACIDLSLFMKRLSALAEMDKLVPGAPKHMRKVFYECLEMTTRAVDLGN